MSPRPVVAITIGVESSAWRPAEDRGRFLPYADAVRQAGGEPVMVGIERSPEIVSDPAAFLARFAGLLLTGGGDVHPAAYPNPPSFPGRNWDEVIAAHHMRVEEGRDAMELLLARAAFAAGAPVLGICRGMQVLNIALGGQLLLDLDPALGHAMLPDRSSAHHPVRIWRGTRLSGTLNGHGERRVNSRHHQGVDEPKVAPLLRPAALAADGVLVEALEAPSHPWLVGVQWHPERPQDAECHQGSRPLFAHFVAACRAAVGEDDG